MIIWSSSCRPSSRRTSATTGSISPSSSPCSREAPREALTWVVNWEEWPPQSRDNMTSPRLTVSLRGVSAVSWAWEIPHSWCSSKMVRYTSIVAKGTSSPRRACWTTYLQTTTLSYRQCGMRTLKHSYCKCLEGQPPDCGPNLRLPSQISAMISSSSSDSGIGHSTLRSSSLWQSWSPP